MRDYLSHKYNIFAQNDQKVFTQQMIVGELLCGANYALMQTKTTLGVARQSMTFEDFLRVIEVTLDLE